MIPLSQGRFFKIRLISIRVGKEKRKGKEDQERRWVSEHRHLGRDVHHGSPWITAFVISKKP